MSIKKDINEFKLTDENGIEWQTHTFNVNGIELRVATDGTTVRLISLGHRYLEIHMQQEMNYMPEYIKSMEYDHKKGWKFIPPEPFIDQGEMEI